MPINYATITRVTTRSNGTQSNEGGAASGFSPDGTKIVLDSRSNDLVTGDTNGGLDVFVKDLVTGAVTRVSNTATGAQADGGSERAVFSPDGAKIAFASFSSTLVPGDTNGTADIFIKDLSSFAIQRVSTSSTGAQGNGISQDFVFSSDGSRIAFSSVANNLVSGDTNDSQDIFIKNLATGNVTRISTTAGGGQADDGSYGAVFSPNGNSVAFTSKATNLVAGDTNAGDDVFIKSLTTGTIVRVSTTADGLEANGRSFYGVYSPSGRQIAFTSDASNLVAGDTNGLADVFLKDLDTGAIQRLSIEPGGPQANGFSQALSFSPDGTKLAFTSTASNLVPGDTNGEQDLFVKDLTTGLITRIDLTAEGLEGNGDVPSVYVTFSPDGTSLLFNSRASNLVPGDTNTQLDGFIVRLTGGTAGNDVLAPLAAGEVVDGAGGSDRLMGGSLGDVLIGGSGADLVQGNAGADTFRLTDNGDVLVGSGATVRNSDMRGSNGLADARGVGGAALTLDVLDGGTGDDLVIGTNGSDVVVLSAPGSAVYTGQSQTARIASIERFELAGGDDVLSLTTTAAAKYTTAVTALGGEGNDTLWTGSGADQLRGENGNDYLVGGFGNDLLEGGAGNDLFGFSRNFGTDSVTDFSQGQDKLRIKGFGTARDSLAEIQPLITTGDFDADGTADDTRIDLSAQGTTILLRDFAGTLTAADFQIVA